MEKKKCVQCGKVFTITDSEKLFFENRNLNLPKRCKECREKNNPHKVKTNNHQGILRKEKVFINRRAYLIISILLIVFCIPYINSKSDQEKYQSEQEVNDSDGYMFKSDSLLQEHFNKHGSEFGYTSTSQYESGANAVINSPEALHKTEAEDGDSVYYIEETNEFVILSTEGYIRTYFKPEDGIEYYNRQ
ncbi:zinc-ribbon domain containing protein [Anaeromicropila populeti]|uniref:Probable zinc-ribbon domain-containing protein n=1 Tax=Anaeromicropila populeti TaxID=37658 RepID=A0A1I6LL53_9FIRM|nr:zinc-ribbon domain containing protein [Anaeromicropila populeti]SFS03992.1 Probable zinc-ribbon domain-containing protein [Anaeromicropila populeti]